MAGKRKEKRFFPVELLIALAVFGILSAVAAPMLSGYLIQARNKAVRGDLKILWNAVETYYSENQDVPLEAGEAIPGWSGYSQAYSYARFGGHEYQIRTSRPVNGVYMYIDQHGSIWEEPASY